MDNVMSHFAEHAQVFPESPREIYMREAREIASALSSGGIVKPIKDSVVEAEATEGPERVEAKLTPASRPKHKLVKFCLGGAWINIPVGVCEFSKDGDAMVISFSEDSAIELSRGVNLIARIDGKDLALKYSDVSLNFPSIPGALHIFLVE